jgi:DNA polymerase-3 subunit alpha
LEVAESQEKLQALAKKNGERKKRPDPIKVACIITDKREVKTKKGDLMAILSIADLTGNEEVAIFPKDFSELDEKCRIGGTVFMDIELSLDGDRLRINAKDCSDLDGSLNKDKRVTIQLDTIDALPALSDAWNSQAKGDTKCELIYRIPKLGEVTVDMGQGISYGKRAKSQIEAISGVSLH